MYYDKATIKKLNSFFDQYKTVNFNKNDIINLDDSNNSNFYFLKKGFVRLFYISKEAKEVTLHIIEPFSHLPITFEPGNQVNEYKYQAITPIEVKITKTEKVIEFIKKDPELLVASLRRVSFDINRLLRRIENSTIDSAYSKIVYLLCYFVSQYSKKEKNQLIITLPFTHDDIGSWIGLNRETVTRQMRKLQLKGIIHYEKCGKLIIKNYKRLREEMTRQD